MYRNHWIALCLLGLVCLAGCSGQLRTYPIEGKVEFEDGSIAMFGDIEFQSVEHKVNARGKINRDGTFKVTTYSEGDGAVAGTHKIVITQLVPPTPVGVHVDHDHGLIVDKKYFSYETSGLTANVDKQPTTVNLVVQAAEH